MAFISCKECIEPLGIEPRVQVMGEVLLIEVTRIGRIGRKLIFIEVIDDVMKLVQSLRAFCFGRSLEL